MIRLFAVLTLALALTACNESPKHAGTTTVDVSYDDLLNQKKISRDVSLGAGDTLVVTLASNASTGYQWSTQAQIGDPAVLAQRDHYSAGPSADRPPGASGTETWTFKALKGGTTTLTTSYGQPWPGGAKDAWTFTANVVVR